MDRKEQEELKKIMSDRKREKLKKQKTKFDFLVKAGGENRAQEEEDDEEDMLMEVRRRKKNKPSKKDKKKKKIFEEVDEDSFSDSEEEDYQDAFFLKQEFKKMQMNQLDSDKDRFKKKLDSFNIQLFP